MSIENAGSGRHVRQSWLYEHLVLITFAVIFCSMTVKVLLVSHGDPVTVSTIVSRQGLTGLAAIIFAVGLPTVVSLLALLTSSMLAEAVREEEGLRGLCIALTAALLLVLLFASVKTFVNLIAFTVSIIGISLATRLIRAKLVVKSKALPIFIRKTSQVQGVSTFLLLVLATCLAMSSLVFNDSFWLSKERISVSQKPLTGYVIPGDGDFTHVILDQTRKTLVVKTSEIEERTLCGHGEDGRSLLVRLLWPEITSYEHCD